MNKFVRLGAAAWMLCLATVSDAQIAGLLGRPLGIPSAGEAGGYYQSNDQIRTFIASGPHGSVDLFAKAIRKAGEMTRAKGFTRFGVTKYSCSTTLVSNAPAATGCYVIAVMLNQGGTAKPRGSRKVHYYEVDDVLAGRISRPED